MLAKQRYTITSRPLCLPLVLIFMSRFFQKIILFIVASKETVIAVSEVSLRELEGFYQDAHFS